MKDKFPKRYVVFEVFQAFLPIRAIFALSSSICSEMGRSTPPLFLEDIFGHQWVFYSSCKARPPESCVYTFGFHSVTHA